MTSETGYTPPNEAHFTFYDGGGEMVVKYDVSVREGVAQIPDPLPDSVRSMEFWGSITGRQPFRIVDFNGAPLRLVQAS